MTDMVERVARRLCIQRGGHPDDTAKVDPRGAVSPMPKGWRAWHDHVNDARAAIEVARAETLAEAEAAVRALPRMREISPDHVRANGPDECADVIRALREGGRCD